MSASPYSKNPNELEILVEITQILTSNLSFLGKCESALRLLADFTHSDVVSLREFNPEISAFDLVAYSSPLIPKENYAIPLSVTNSLSAKAMTDNQPVVANDYPAHDRQNQRYVTLGMNSALAVPVYIDEEPFGTLGFGSKSLNHYDERKVEVVAAVASVVGMMIAKAKLQEVHGVEANIGQIISAPLVGPDVFNQFAAEAEKIISFDRLALNSVDIEAGTYVTEFLIGERVPDYSVGISQNVSGTVLEAVVQARVSRRFRLDDGGVTVAEFPRMGPFFAEGQHFLISVPFIIGNQVIGTMNILRASRPFSQKDMANATRLGNLLGGAFGDYKQQEYRV